MELIVTLHILSLIVQVMQLAIAYNVLINK